jgi:hypothetical protein
MLLAVRIGPNAQKAAAKITTAWQASSYNSAGTDKETLFVVYCKTKRDLRRQKREQIRTSSHFLAFSRTFSYFSPRIQPPWNRIKHT